MSPFGLAGTAMMVGATFCAGEPPGDAPGVAFGAFAEGGVPRCCAARLPASKSETDQRSARCLIRSGEDGTYGSESKLRAARATARLDACAIEQRREHELGFENLAGELGRRTCVVGVVGIHGPHRLHHVA